MLEHLYSEEYEDYSKAVEVTASITKDIFNVGTMATIIKEECVQDKQIGSKVYENTSTGVEVFIKQEPLMREDFDSEEYENYSKAIEITPLITEEVSDVRSTATIINEECLQDASYNERVLGHIGEQCETKNAGSHQFILQPSRNTPQEEFILPDNIDNIYAVKKTFKKETVSCEKVTEEPKEISFKANFGPISIKEELGIFSNEATDQVYRTVLCPRMHKEYKWRDSNAKGCFYDDSNETKHEDVTSHVSTPRASLTQQSSHRHSRPQTSKEEESMFEESDSEENTTKESDTDERKCKDVMMHSSGEVGERRLDWSFVVGELPLKKVTCDADDEEDKMCSCNICGNTFTSYNSIVRHMKDTHTDKEAFLCEICRKGFKTKEKLILHSKIHCDAIGFVCDICRKNFSRKRELKNHILKHTLPHKCSICGRNFSYVANFKRHMRSHTDERLYQCNVCGKNYSIKEKLSRHKLSHISPHQCETCKKSFTRLSTLKVHMRAHTGEKPYLCTFCKKRFSTKQNMDYHMHTHTGERPFPCNICKHRSLTKQAFVKHMRTHAEEKPFPCTVCKKCFSNKSYLVDHMRIHAEENPFSCSVCKKCFCSKKSLVKHVHTHKEEKP